MPDFTPVLVTQSYTDASGAAASGALDFVLTAPMHNSTTGRIIPATPITVPLTSGAISVALWANTDPTTLPVDTAYTVTERLSGQDARRYRVVIPHDAPGGTVVLGLLVPLDAPTFLALPPQPPPLPAARALATPRDPSESFTAVHLTEDFIYADGGLPNGESRVEFLLTTPLTNSATGRRVPAAPIVAHLDSAGHLSVTLWATDDLTTVPVGAAYRVTERIAGQDPQTYYIVLPATAPGGEAILGLLVPGTTAPPTYYVLASVTVPPPFKVRLVGGTAAIMWDPDLGEVGDVPVRTADGVVFTPLGVVGGDKHYFQSWGTPQTTIVVAHMLGKYPAVTVRDSAGSHIACKVIDDSLDQCTVYSIYPFTGSVACN